MIELYSILHLVSYAMVQLADGCMNATTLPVSQQSLKA